MTPKEVLKQLKQTPVFYIKDETEDNETPYNSSFKTYSKSDKSIAESYVDAVINRMKDKDEHILDAIASITRSDLKKAVDMHEDGSWLHSPSIELVVQKKVHMFNAAKEFLKPEMPNIKAELMKNNLKDNLFSQLSGYSGENPKVVLDMMSSLAHEFEAHAWNAGMCRTNEGSVDNSEGSYKESSNSLSEKVTLNRTSLKRAERMMEQLKDKSYHTTDTEMSP